jgi:hypothetical protein
MSHSPLSFFFFFFLDTLHVLDRCSTAWAMSPALFAFFQIGSHVFAWTGLDCSPILCLPHSLDDRCMPPCPVFWLRWDLTTFLPGLALNSWATAPRIYFGFFVCLFFWDQISLYSPECCQTQSSCLSLLSAEITGVSHSTKLHLIPLTVFGVEFTDDIHRDKLTCLKVQASWSESSFEPSVPNYAVFSITLWYLHGFSQCS